MTSFKKKVIGICAAITAVAVILALIPPEKNFVMRGIKSVCMPVVSVLSDGARSAGGLRAFLAEMQSYRDENERLLQEVAQLRRETRSAGEYKRENERLTALLELENDMDVFYDTTPARVVSYEPNNWYDTLVLNKGTAHGVHPGDAVICSDGAVGKVTDAGINWARVVTVIHHEHALSVRIVRTGSIAVVEGDKQLEQEKLCKLTFIDSSVSVIAGDILETSGSGGVYPEGQIVGTVREIKSDSAANQYAIVEPAVDFDRLYEVLIVSEKQREQE